MIIKIPNLNTYDIKYILLDYNGTIASSGNLLPSIREYFELLSKDFKLYVVSGDTFHNVRSQLKNDPVEILLTDSYNSTESKLQILNEIGASNCIAIGNGSIDAKMLRHAAISIAVIGDEGLSKKAFENSDIVVKSIEDAINLILEPKKLIATLRE